MTTLLGMITTFNYIVGDVLMGLSKDFDYIPHDLLIAKLDSYDLDRNLLKLENRKQCARINNINSDFNDIISSVQGKYCLLMIFFLLMQHATVHNFTDNNTHASQQLLINSRKFWNMNQNVQ